MFTGIIEELGIVERIVPGKIMHLVVRVQHIQEQIRNGDSVSVNGVCLTVVKVERQRLAFDVIAPTQEASAIGRLRVGEGVNLERAMPANGRFGGHMVSGHIDGVGTIMAKEKDAEGWIITVQASASIMCYLVPKGSVAVDGVSLTVAAIEKERFVLGLIPFTASHTTLGFKEKRDLVNIEVDVVGKYVFRYLSTMNRDSGEPGTEKNKLQLSYLRTMGFLDE